MTPILDQLARFTTAAPSARKLLVAPDLNAGRDLLAALALRIGGWVGWRAVTLRVIADELAFVGMSRDRVRPARDLEVPSLIASGVEAHRAAGRLSPMFMQLHAGFGFRRAVKDAVLQLRVAGIGHQELASADDGVITQDLALVLRGYEDELEHRHLTDSGGIFARALLEFETESPYVLPEHVYLLPGLADRGQPGMLADRLVDRGAVRLAEPEPWSDQPGPGSCTEVSLFMAATPSDEVREMLRRIRMEGRSWDEVEVVVTDPDSYGIALEAVASRLEIPVTFQAGLPLGRSRLGRIIDRWFNWIEAGLPDRLIREAIEAGDLAADGESPSPQLVRLMRVLAIGWGRVRYERAIAELQRGIKQRPDPEFPENESGDEDWASAARQLRTILERLIESTPAGPEPGGVEPPPVPPAALAGALRIWLGQSPPHDEPERHARTRLDTRLGLIERELSTPHSFGAALAALGDILADFRVWPTLGPDGRPWCMAGGHLHLTDLSHAGTTGRGRIFVLGLDMERAAGPRVQDPLLPDALRSRLGNAIATTSERRAARRLEIDRALASLRGSVTLSWAISGDGGREVSPAPVLLRVARQTLGQHALAYEELRGQLSPPAGAVPSGAGAPLDSRDVWLAAIASGPALLDLNRQVSARWPTLERGLAIAREWESGGVTAAHGLVPAASTRDPRQQRQPISASSLELLARCPLAWLYRHGMRVRPVGDATFDPGVWLSPLDRGLLLHAVFERFARDWMHRQGEIDSAMAEAVILETAREVFAEWQLKVPAPGPAAVDAEWSFVERSARSFLMMERDGQGSSWLDCEIDLLAGRRPPELRLADGSEIAIRGRIDRVDRRQDGSLVVIDFKTGSTYGFTGGSRGGPFKGGRQLQPGVYALAAEQLFEAKVVAFEYRFPTPRGENHVVRLDRGQLESAREVILDLLGQVERGEFLPTFEDADCHHCDFREICRVRDGAFGGVDSPRADWAATVQESDLRYLPMRRRRGKTGT